MPPRHRRPAKRDGALHAIFAILPWWGPVAALVAVDGGIVTFGNANQWPAPLTKAWLLPATVIIGGTGIGAWIERFRHRNLLANTRELDHLKALTPRQFEEIVLAAYRKHGYTGGLTGRGADGGVDVILERRGEKTYVQCKRWRTATIAVDPLRALKGSMATEGVTKGIFVCCGRFTTEAERYAADSGITCVDGVTLLVLINGVQPAAAPGATAPTAATSLPHATPSCPSIPNNQPSAPATDTATPPLCPNCEQRMVPRTSKRGQFWGCAGFPACRGIRPIAT